MIGRYASLNVYQEIFSSADFVKLAFGTLLIPVSAVLAPSDIPGLPLSRPELALVLSILVNGGPIILSAAKGLVRKQLNVDELVSLAIIACIINQNYFEAAVVAAIKVFGALVEEAVSDSARDAIRKLTQVTPDKAVVLKEGKECPVETSKIRPGDILLVRQGQVIAVDGLVLEGQAGVQEASLTGEPLPVRKEEGDTVYAGTACVDGYLKLESTRVGTDSAIGKIIGLVEGAEQSKLGSTRIVDRYAAWFTPVILGIALAAFAVTQDLSRAVTVLIVGCPCSFLLAGPVTTVAAVGRAARSGILVRGGQYLENIARAKTFCFDKTGTLTTGSPSVVEITPARGWDELTLLALASALESKSLHPLARAIVEKAEKMDIPPKEAVRVKSLPGKGIEGMVDGKMVRIETGNTRDKRGFTVVEIWADKAFAGEVCLEDLPRPEAAGTMKVLRRMGIEKLAIISGDGEAPVKKLARVLGIQTWFAGQTPEDKLDTLSGLGRGIVYLGDGINDAPVLKAADTGIAKGARGRMWPLKPQMSS